MSQSGELINATLQCIGDSSDNVHCTRTHQTIRPGFQIAVTHLSASSKTRKSLQNLKNHQTGDSPIWLQGLIWPLPSLRWLTAGTPRIWLAATRLKDHKIGDSSDCNDQGLVAKVALAPQGWRTSHVWWFCKVGSATAPRCWCRECFERIYKFWRQNSD